MYLSRVNKQITSASENIMEQCIEKPYLYDDEKRFTESDISVSGDSGAAIIDEDTNAFVRQL